MKWGRIILVIFGALIITALGIDAADTINGSEGTFLARVIAKPGGLCPEGMVNVDNIASLACVDRYEASPSPECKYAIMESVVESDQNTHVQGCHAVSVPNATPWSFINLPQAQLMCAQAGKRLPTSEEWYQLALGTDSADCVVNNDTPKTSELNRCKSAVGTHDMVGNVWEWVSDTINANTYKGRALPSGGYVTSVDSDGVAITSAEVADDLYGKDYFWSKEEGVFGMIRGGFYGSNEDAGLYTINASVPTSFATQGVGFRCVQDAI